MLNYASFAMSTPQASPAGRVIRFGVFEADLSAAELRKGGVRIRLQEQPFQVLAYLLQHPGEVVSREDLRQRLWPSDTFVDFDHSLNTAVNKLREALGDSASSPRYVETLARKGYRFVAPVQAPKPAPAATPSLPSTDHPELDVPLPNRRLMRGLFGLIQIMYLIFYLSALFHLPDLGRITESFVPGWKASALFVAVIVTAGVGIILRCYLLSAVSFDYGRLRDNFERLFLAILVLDQLWAISPFLITENIGFGAAFAATAALLYVPFAERTLLRMAYPKAR